jgi:hypothetical protein
MLRYIRIETHKIEEKLKTKECESENIVFENQVKMSWAGTKT